MNKKLLFFLCLVIALMPAFLYFHFSAKKRVYFNYQMQLESVFYNDMWSRQVFPEDIREIYSFTKRGYFNEYEDTVAFFASLRRSKLELNGLTVCLLIDNKSSQSVPLNQWNFIDYLLANKNIMIIKTPFDFCSSRLNLILRDSNFNLIDVDEISKFWGKKLMNFHQKLLCSKILPYNNSDSATTYFKVVNLSVGKIKYNVLYNPLKLDQSEIDLVFAGLKKSYLNDTALQISRIKYMNIPVILSDSSLLKLKKIIDSCEMK